MRTLANFTIENKTVALRVDLNVPIQEGQILDDTRITAILPTVKYLLLQNAKIILKSEILHFVFECQITKYCKLHSKMLPGSRRRSGAPGKGT